MERIVRFPRVLNGILMTDALSVTALFGLEERQSSKVRSMFSALDDITTQSVKNDLGITENTVVEGLNFGKGEFSKLIDFLEAVKSRKKLNVARSMYPITHMSVASIL